jgi:hypothetical protein
LRGHRDQRTRAATKHRISRSRIESQTDLYLSTLANYLEAMGGRLELVGVFDGDTRVTLNVDDVTGEPPRDLSRPA